MARNAESSTNNPTTETTKVGSTYAQTMTTTPSEMPYSSVQQNYKMKISDFEAELEKNDSKSFESDFKADAVRIEKGVEEKE